MVGLRILSSLSLDDFVCILFFPSYGNIYLKYTGSQQRVVATTTRNSKGLKVKRVSKESKKFQDDSRS